LIEEKQASPPRFAWSMSRGEPCWLINDDWSFAKYCPWCGTKLPEDGVFER
jgi:hypothetical protein